MSLLSYIQLLELIDNNVITGVDEVMVNSSSIDLTLGETVLCECSDMSKQLINLRERYTLHTSEFKFTEKSPFLFLYPGQFILAQTEQKFFLPNNISGEYKLKSSMARSGLEHLNAGWCDAGWNNSVLTLELKNITQHHTIILQRGDRIGQMVFFQHEEVPHNRSYGARGRYNGDNKVTGVKP